jgi:two-component system NtrC family sensor kinase
MAAIKKVSKKNSKTTAKATLEPALKTAKAVKTQDNTELLEFVENLKRQWVSTIDALVDPLMIVNSEYEIQKSNMAMARMAEKEVKSIVGKKCFEIFGDRKSPCPNCQLGKSFKSSKSSSFDLENVRGDRYFEVASQPLVDTDGTITGVVHVYRDRTEAKKMQEKLSQQDKLASIGLLAGGIAHEINNPLGGILIFSQMLLREIPKDSPHYEDVFEIEAATQRCKAIVESLLNFARQNQPDSKKKMDEFNIADAIKTAVRFGKVAIKKSGSINVIEKFKEPEQYVKVDRNKVIQIFLNLIQNGIQAMPDGGTLTIKSKTVTRNALPWGIFTVEDTGIGIPTEHLTKIFDPFFTTKDPGEGTGLGLALVYGIVQDMGGTMSVESTVNVGSRFIVELPLSRSVGKNKQKAS